MNPDPGEVVRVADAVEQRIGSDPEYAARILGQVARDYLSNKGSYQLDKLIEEAAPKQKTEDFVL